MDRNFWDLRTPTGWIDLLKDGSVVELCIYSFEHSAKSTDTEVRQDVEVANRIWCQGKINVQAIHWERLAAFPPDGGPFDLNVPNLAEQIDPRNFPDAGRDQFFGIGRPNCPSGDPTKFVAVYYIPGNHFQNSNATGFAMHRFATGQPPVHVILLTDGANGQLLAHELGHTLLTRQTEPDQWEAEDPGPGRNAGDPQHNVNPHNLMSPMVAADPQITPEQVSQARGSRLVSSQKLAFGFRENEPYKMAVKMKNMHVDWTEDEATSDDALESKWEFRVKSGLDNSMIPWEHSRLKAGDYDLSHMDFAFRNMKSDDDKLIIEVTGEDWDFWSPNDPLPRVYKEWEKGTDLWGSGSRDDPNAALGDHTHGPVENAEMKYSLTYNIRVWSKPEEQIFRSICAD